MNTLSNEALMLLINYYDHTLIATPNLLEPPAGHTKAMRIYQQAKDEIKQEAIQLEEIISHFCSKEKLKELQYK